MKKTGRWLPLLVFLLVLFPAGLARAEEVRAEHQGLEVLGSLDLAPGKSLKTDGAVLLLHDSLGHHRV